MAIITLNEGSFESIKNTLEENKCRVHMINDVVQLRRIKEAIDVILISGECIDGLNDNDARVKELSESGTLIVEVRGEGEERLADTTISMKQLNKRYVGYLLKYDEAEGTGIINRHFNNGMYKMMEANMERTVDSQMAVLVALADMEESRDMMSSGHLDRVQEICLVLTTNLGGTHYESYMTNQMAYAITAASVIHDIGKVGIPDKILNKNGRLTGEEFAVMMKHVEIGEGIINKLKSRYNNNYLDIGLEIVSSHHERWDGKGYPRGIAGTSIPLSGRIMAIADVYDALRSKRPYKEPISHDGALKIIVDGKGTQFDPILVDVFIKNCHEIKSTYLSNLEASEENNISRVGGALG